jgi:hypothetical protein
MREVLFKSEITNYETIEYKSCSPIKEKLDEFDFNMVLHGQSTSKHPLFIHHKTYNTEEIFSENFANPMFSITKTYFMVVVEKEGDKVAIKIFNGFKHRRAGVQWFKKSKSMQFITVNTKTGDVYVGGITNYHLKKKCRKNIRRNYFINDPLGQLVSIIKNNMKDRENKESSFAIAVNAVSTFMNHIDYGQDYGDLTFSQRLFKFYLNKRGIKFPNNFHVFMPEWFGPDIRKHLKKNDNRMVDAIMKHFDVSGKKVKKALHNCTYLNLGPYKFAKTLFGDDWLNQDDTLILECFNSNISFSDLPPNFLNFVSNEELKRVFELFKEVIIKQTLDSYTFSDHIRMYTNLKEYGEQDLKWMSSKDSKSSFREEHLDWTDKIQYYRQGVYTRIYPDYSYDFINKSITIGEDTYYPVLLDETSNYNEESSLQSNCVKTYIGKCSSIIVSLRKGSNDSNERATIEYKLNKTMDGDLQIKRVQSLGRFNNSLSKEWDEVLFKLDEQMLYYIKDEKFDTVKIKKVCANGVELNSNSDWTDNGNLQWDTKDINKNNNFQNEYGWDYFV